MENSILLVHDWVTVGKVAGPMMTPIFSIAGFNVSFLPTVYLSTHTGGFPSNVIHPMTQIMQDSLDHLNSLPISFDYVVTGYFAGNQEIETLIDNLKQPLMNSAQVIVDPVMADKGKLYRGFDASYPQVMKDLVHKANILLPNITEACLLTDTPYLGDDYTLEQVDQLVDKLHALGPERVILTGISFDSQQIGFYASDKSSRIYVSHERFQEDFYGTGDLSTALISSLLIKGVNVQKTLDFTVKWMHTILECSLASGKPIKYGLSIEPLLIDLGLAMRELCNV